MVKETTWLLEPPLDIKPEPVMVLELAIIKLELHHLEELKEVKAR